MTFDDLQELIIRAGYDPDTINFFELEKQMRKAQIQKADEHKAQRAINRSKKKSNRDRAKRTHELCNIGGAALIFFPKLNLFTQEELEEWFYLISCNMNIKREYAEIANFKTERTDNNS